VTTPGVLGDRSSFARLGLPPLVEPSATLSALEIERYARHVLIPEVGMAGQRRLKNARVLVVGAGRGCTGCVVGRRRCGGCCQIASAASSGWPVSTCRAVMIFSGCPEPGGSSRPRVPGRGPRRRR